MAKKIKAELAESLKYDLKCHKDKEGRELVLFTRDNVARVESMIRNDSDYSDQGTSSATYWLRELSKVLSGKKSTHKYEEIIQECVNGVDRTNSTHINADGVGREELAQRICKLSKETLVEYLKNPRKEHYKLIEILSQPTHPKDSKHYARKNYSFATKFCHYAAFYVFENDEEQDNFSIYDSVVAKNIKPYAKYYGLKVSPNIGSNYDAFISLVDGIIQKSGKEISRNGFDHLLWYFHKAR